MRLQRRALHLAGLVCSLDNSIAFTESLLHIADSTVGSGRDVVSYIPMERELVNDLTVPFIRIPVVLIKIVGST